MSVLDDLLQSARALEGAAVALAHSLRPSTKLPNASPALVETFRECEAFAITTRAVMEEAAPILPLLSAASTCVGRSPRVVATSARICNGFDSLALILLTLFDAATTSILDVAGNHSRWLVSPLHASSGLNKMQAHHGQLRALYGIIHLAAKIVTHADVNTTLFVPVSGSDAHPELEPARWRAAIKMDHFYGRHFGFHYTPDMRNVLRVVSIARESVAKSHAGPDSASSSPLVQNMAMLGWGWVYSNMVLMSNLGLPIDAVNQIGADSHDESVSIAALRKFMNLVEEPLVAGVSGLASADVTIDRTFFVPYPGMPGGLEAVDSPEHSELLREVLASVCDPVLVRVMSCKSRPTKFPSTYRDKSSKPARDKNGEDPAAHVAPQRLFEKGEGNGNVADIGKTFGGTTGAEQSSRSGENIGLQDVLPNRSNSAPIRSSGQQVRDNNVEVSAVSPPKPTLVVKGMTEHGQPTSPKRFSVMPQPTSVKSPQREDEKRSANSGNAFLEKRSSISETLAGAADNSYLASTIKSELIKLHSNVSSFLGIEEAKPAPGLIVHFHGGGFVSQSSTSHAVYMKEWCADIPDAVLLSIDYKLAPEYKFPVAVHECVYAYIWALRNVERLGTLAERIVFAGDSAGGNLAVATALKLAELGIRQPDGICIAYPALYVNIAWSPSRLLSFFDPMLPLSVLELCVKSYLPGDQCSSDRGNPLLSPVKASHDLLKALPPVTMICGSLDPLLDDSVLFAHRLMEAGRTGDMLRIYESMPHGFLNMSLVNVTARAGMKFLAKMIAEYLELPLRKGSRAAGSDPDDQAAHTEKPAPTAGLSS